MNTRRDTIGTDPNKWLRDDYYDDFEARQEPDIPKTQKGMGVRALLGPVAEGQPASHRADMRLPVIGSRNSVPDPYYADKKAKNLL